MTNSVQLWYDAPRIVPIYLAGLAIGGYVASDVIDNSVDLYLDVLVTLKLPTTVTPANTCQVAVLAFGSVDGGATFSDGVTGKSGSFTPTATAPNLTGVGGAQAVSTSPYNFLYGPWSVAAAFGGVIPQKWGLVVYNNLGCVFPSAMADVGTQWMQMLGVKATVL